MTTIFNTQDHRIQGYDGVRETTYTELTKGGMRFNLVDQKGREIGYKYWIQRVQVTLLSDEEYRARPYGGVWRKGEPLDYIEGNGHVTRDGKAFGSSRKGKKFKTQKEAMAYLERRMLRSHKDYAKKFARFNTPAERLAPRLGGA